MANITNKSVTTDGQTITLYDIPTKGGKCSSMNVWKARATLNFKSLPYQTEWLEYPEIAPKLSSFGISKNDPKEYAEYWLPVVKLPDGRYIMESTKISEELDRLHPSPPLYVASEKTAQASEIIDKIMFAIAPGYIYRYADDVINESNRQWYHDARGKLFQKKDLYEVGEIEAWKGENSWQNAQAGFNELAVFLKENDSGPFVMGDKTSYADFVVGAMWQWANLLSRNGDIYDRVMSQDPSFAEHEKACAKWYQKDT